MRSAFNCTRSWKLLYFKFNTSPNTMKSLILFTKVYSIMSGGLHQFTDRLLMMPKACVMNTGQRRRNYILFISAEGTCLTKRVECNQRSCICMQNSHGGDILSCISCINKFITLLILPFLNFDFLSNIP